MDRNCAGRKRGSCACRCTSKNHSVQRWCEMSLSKSPAARPEEAGPALRDAFVEVCERSFFAYAETSDGDRFAELTDRVSRTARAWEEGDAHARRSAVSEWLKASVGFSGPLAGAIEVILPEE